MGFPEAYYAGERTVEQVAYEEGRKPGHLGVWKGRHSSYKSLYRYERFIGHRDNLKKYFIIPAHTIYFYLHLLPLRAGNSQQIYSPNF